jgi:hypothetical protein
VRAAAQNYTFARLEYVAHWLTHLAPHPVQADGYGVHVERTFDVFSIVEHLD